MRYEQLTSRSEETFAWLCAFLSVPVELDALRETNPEQIRWNPDPYLFGEIKAHTKDWLDHVARHEAVEIERQLAPIMKTLGY